jgi:hypothetical protein
LADNGTLAKAIFYNTVCQTQRPAGIAAVDAENFYNKIAYLIASLVFQLMGVLIMATTFMLSTIQDMSSTCAQAMVTPKNSHGQLAGSRHKAYAKEMTQPQLVGPPQTP